jgi:hypothetical protein
VQRAKEEEEERKKKEESETEEQKLERILAETTKQREQDQATLQVICFV